MKKRVMYIGLMRGAMVICTMLTVSLVLFILVYVLMNGIPNISWGLLTTKPSYLTGKIGILPDILNTLYIVIATIIIVLPLGVGTAIYLAASALALTTTSSILLSPLTSIS